MQQMRLRADRERRNARGERNADQLRNLRRSL
jgi:hypothetical protein